MDVIIYGATVIWGGSLNPHPSSPPELFILKSSAARFLL